jgi:hypothetical protein
MTHAELDRRRPGRPDPPGAGAPMDRADRDLAERLAAAAAGGFTRDLGAQLAARCATVTAGEETP